MLYLLEGGLAHRHTEHLIPEGQHRAAMGNNSIRYLMYNTLIKINPPHMIHAFVLTLNICAQYIKLHIAIATKLMLYTS